MTRLLRWPHLATLLIVLALGIRLLHADAFLFKEDEARAMQYAEAISEQGERPTHSWTSSVGVDNPAVFPYLLALFTALRDDPVFVQLALILMSGWAVAFSAPLLRRLLDDEADANLALALLAFSPSAIHFSRKIWDPVPLPFLLAPALLLFLRVLERPRSRSIALLLPLLAIAGQIHQSALFLILLLGLLALWHRPRLHASATVGGLLLAALLLAPYALHLAGTLDVQWAEYRARGSFAGPDVDVLTNWLLTVCGLQTYHHAGREALQLMHWPFFGAGVLLQLALAALLAPFLWWGSRELLRENGVRLTRRAPFLRLERRPRWNLLLVCILGLPAAYLLLGVRGVPHYYLPALPVLYALVPLGARWRRRGRERARWPRWVVAAPVLFALQWLLYLGLIVHQQGGTSYGPTYATARQAAIAAAAFQPRGEPYRVRVSGYKLHGDLPRHWAYLLERAADSIPLPPAPGEPYLHLELSWDRPFDPLLGPVHLERKREPAEGADAPGLDPEAPSL